MKHLLFILALFISAQAFAYDKPYIGENEEYWTEYEDTFIHLALKHDLGYVEMRAANPYVDPWVPGRNTKLVLPKRHILPDTKRTGLVINLPEMRMYYYQKDGEEPVTHPIGVGREGLDTPTGVTKIVRKKEGPTWTPTKRMRDADPTLPAVVPAGKDNPLGSHAMYLGWPEYLIHGTNRVFGIGRRISSGCIRMYPADIIHMFGIVPVGTRVEVVNQPLKLAWIDDKLFLEAHPDLEQSIAMEEMGEVKSTKMTNDDMALIKKIAGDAEDKIRWAAVRTIIKERRGYPIEIARR
jgi:L,D-transpeptidase ErfK/SrfK